MKKGTLHKYTWIGMKSDLEILISQFSTDTASVKLLSSFIIKP